MEIVDNENIDQPNTNLELGKEPFCDTDPSSPRLGFFFNALSEYSITGQVPDWYYEFVDESNSFPAEHSKPSICIRRIFDLVGRLAQETECYEQIHERVSIAIEKTEEALQRFGMIKNPYYHNLLTNPGFLTGFVFPFAYEVAKSNPDQYSQHILLLSSALVLFGSISERNVTDNNTALAEELDRKLVSHMVIAAGHNTTERQLLARAEEAQREAQKLSESPLTNGYPDPDLVGKAERLMSEAKTLTEEAYRHGSMADRHRARYNTIDSEREALRKVQK